MVRLGPIPDYANIYTLNDKEFCLHVPCRRKLLENALTALENVLATLMALGLVLGTVLVLL